jgi:hypothetical protein
VLDYDNRLICEWHKQMAIYREEKTIYEVLNVKKENKNKHIHNTIEKTMISLICCTQYIRNYNLLEELYH